ncbi:MAG: flagellar basal-body rod protein FlgF [Gammaproteobacteria bacterium]|nr:MAG: flagellar basal-body rod protein FlgF [Gammaproteobacteria bacterium]
MDRLIYTAMSGAKQIMDKQSVISNNLANVSTSGFRAELHAMRSVPVQGDAPLATRSSVALATTGADFSPGPISTTGRELDVAIKGDGWLAVQASDGSEAYTRRGDLQVDGNGLLTSGGRPVIGEGGPIQLPLGAQVFIGADGTLSAIGEGEDPEALADVGRLKLVSARDKSLLRGEDGLFRPAPDAEGNVARLAQDENIQVASGALEGSNVSAVQSMVDMIGSARQYEMQMKIIKSAEENEQRANSLLSVNN